MQSPPTPENEQARLADLASFDILDTPPEQAYDDISFLASTLCGTPIALMSLVDSDRQWFKSRVGLDQVGSDRGIAICAHTIAQTEDLLVISDLQADDRFVDNPYVTQDPRIRFYAGAPLMTANGNAIGTLCVLDLVPRELTTEQRAALSALSRQIVAQLELRRIVTTLERSTYNLSRSEEQLQTYQAQLEEQLAAIAVQSTTDPLTGVKNRRALISRLDQELKRSARYGSGFAVAMVDVDKFKAFNDKNGHVAGDAALTKIARMLDDGSRPSDLVARYGGEEFFIVLPEGDISAAAQLGERLRHDVEQADWGDDPLTISIGVASSTECPADPLALIEAADKAMYRAKEAGRNQVAS